MQLIDVKIKYFDHSQHRNTPGNIVCGSGSGALNQYENEVFQQRLVPKYFEEYCFVFGAICALNTHKNKIFRHQQRPKYLGENCFAFGII